MKKEHQLFRITIRINKHGPGIITSESQKNRRKRYYKRVLSSLSIFKSLILIQNGVENFISQDRIFI